MTSYIPELASADSYFGKHPRSVLWNALSPEEREGALILSAGDIAGLLPEGRIDRNEPLQLLAVYEQAIYLVEALNLEEKNAAPTPQVIVSERIDGVGERTYGATAKPAELPLDFNQISPRALRMLTNYLHHQNEPSTQLTRG